MAEIISYEETKPGINLTVEQEDVSNVIVEHPVVSLIVQPLGAPGRVGLPGLPGEPGPPGPPGPPGTGSSNVVVLLQAIASDVWEFQHSFLYKPDVDTFDQNGDPVEGDVSYPNSTTVRITFGFEMTGSLQLS